MILVLAACLFHHIEATCSIEERADLDTHLEAYFTDPEASHACGDISTWDVSKVENFNGLFQGQDDFNAGFMDGSGS